jgi:hypothetical protein
MNPMDLSDWTLAVAEYEVELTLPEISVPGGGSVLLVFGSNNAQLHNPPSVNYIEEIDLQDFVDHDGFSVELVDPAGRVAESLAIKSVTSNLEKEYCTIS